MIAVFSFNLLNFLGITDTSGNDTVNKSGAEVVLCINPFCKLLAKSPVIDILVNYLLKLLTVVIDKLAGEDDEAGKLVLKSSVKELCDLCREGCGRSIVFLALGIVSDTCLCCV